VLEEQYTLFIGAEGYNEIGRLVECIHFNITEPHIMIVFNRILQNLVYVIDFMVI
jgi:hypothetical protein